MALVTGAFTTYDATANREDLSNIISMISPTDTPFISAIGKTKATNTLFEWQTYSLAAASTTNAHLEGDAFTGVTSSPTTRQQNYAQISKKEVVVSGTQQAMDHAGIADYLSKQIAWKGLELRRDMESIATGVQGYNAGNSTTARKTRALGSWLTSNVSRATDGASATAATAAPTDGTARALTETLLKAVIKSTYESGGNPSLLMVGSFNKQAVSAFTGRTSARQNVNKEAILGAASIYMSDFGDLKVVPNRFQRGRDAWLIDPELANIAYLRNFKTEEIAKVGDAVRKHIIVEWGLQMENEAGHGVVADLTTS